MPFLQKSWNCILGFILCPEAYDLPLTRVSNSVTMSRVVKWFNLTHFHIKTTFLSHKRFYYLKLYECGKGAVLYWHRLLVHWLRWWVYWLCRQFRLPYKHINLAGQNQAPECVNIEKNNIIQWWLPPLAWDFCFRLRIRYSFKSYRKTHLKS